MPAISFTTPEMSKQQAFPVQGMHNFIALTNVITNHRSDANEIVDMMARRPNVSSNDDANGGFSNELKQIRSRSSVPDARQVELESAECRFG